VKGEKTLGPQLKKGICSVTGLERRKKGCGFLLRGGECITGGWKKRRNDLIIRK